MLTECSGHNTVLVGGYAGVRVWDLQVYGLQHIHDLCSRSLLPRWQLRVLVRPGSGPILSPAGGMTWPGCGQDVTTPVIGWCCGLELCIAEWQVSDGLSLICWWIRDVPPGCTYMASGWVFYGCGICQAVLFAVCLARAMQPGRRPLTHTGDSEYIHAWVTLNIRISIYPSANVVSVCKKLLATLAYVVYGSSGTGCV